MKTVGLTGGIGSGKTTVANFFKALGAPVFIADVEAKNLMNGSAEVKREISNLFGGKAYSAGILNRKYIASMVFRDREKLEALNAIVHPAVRKHFQSWRKKQDFPYVVYEAAILFESGSDKICDFIIVVTAKHQEKITRLLKRDRSDQKDIEDRMANQWTDEKRKPLADFVIENQELNQTQKKVKEIHQILVEAP